MDALLLKIYEKVLRILFAIPAESDSGARVCKRLVSKRLKSFVGQLLSVVKAPSEGFAALPALVNDCLEHLMKTRSLLSKYSFPEKASEDEKRCVEAIVTSLVEKGQYETTNPSDYGLVYSPILRGMKLADIRAPNEREV